MWKTTWTASIWKRIGATFTENQLLACKDLKNDSWMSRLSKKRAAQSRRKISDHARAFYEMPRLSWNKWQRLTFPKSLTSPRFIASRGLAPGVFIWSNAGPSESLISGTVSIRKSPSSITQGDTHVLRSTISCVGIRLIHHTKSRYNAKQEQPNPKSQGQSSLNSVPPLDSPESHSTMQSRHGFRRPTKEELLATATGFLDRLTIRFKFALMRQVRPFNVDDFSAFFSWLLLGHVVWILVGTTTFFSLAIFTANTVFAQGEAFKLIYRPC
jgi:hypothetical protein